MFKRLKSFFKTLHHHMEFIQSFTICTQKLAVICYLIFWNTLQL